MTDLENEMFDLEQGLEAFNKSDYLTAFHALQPFAEKGDKQSQICLGVMFEMGLGVPQNYSEMFKWVSRASEQGEPRANFKLGEMHYNGLYVQKNYKQAGKLFTESAGKGMSFAQFNLGEMYENGYGIQQNTKTAHMWYNISASNGYEKGAEARDRLAVDMTVDEILEAQELALDWFEKNPKPAS